MDRDRHGRLPSACEIPDQGVGDVRALSPRGITELSLADDHTAPRAGNAAAVITAEVSAATSPGRRITCWARRYQRSGSAAWKSRRISLVPHSPSSAGDTVSTAKERAEHRDHARGQRKQRCAATDEQDRETDQERECQQFGEAQVLGDRRLDLVAGDDPAPDGDVLVGGRGRASRSTPHPRPGRRGACGRLDEQLDPGRRHGSGCGLQHPRGHLGVGSSNGKCGLTEPPKGLQLICATVHESWALPLVAPRRGLWLTRCSVPWRA